MGGNKLGLSYISQLCPPFNFQSLASAFFPSSSAPPQPEACFHPARLWGSCPPLCEDQAPSCRCGVSHAGSRDSARWCEPALGLVPCEVLEGGAVKHQASKTPGFPKLALGNIWLLLAAQTLTRVLHLKCEELSLPLASAPTPPAPGQAPRISQGG